MAMSVTYTTINGVIVHEALAGGGERELTADPLGSLVKIRTSAVNYSYSAEYWPYGEIQAQTGSNPTRWAFVGLLGYMRDLATMFYVRARYYRSALTRWMTVDPLWPHFTAYEYARANPASETDPSGKLPVWVIIIAILAACSLCAGLHQTSPFLHTNDTLMHCVNACEIAALCGPICGILAALGGEAVQWLENLLGDNNDVTIRDTLNNLMGVPCGLVYFGTPFMHLLKPLREWCVCCCSKAPLLPQPPPAVGGGSPGGSSGGGSPGYGGSPSHGYGAKKVGLNWNYE